MANIEAHLLWNHQNQGGTVIFQDTKQLELELASKQLEKTHRNVLKIPQNLQARHGRAFLELRLQSHAALLLRQNHGRPGPANSSTTIVDQLVHMTCHWGPCRLTSLNVNWPRILRNAWAVCGALLG